MKGENSDYQANSKTWPSFCIVFSVTVLYVLSVLAGVVLFIQYKDIKDLEFRVLNLEKECVLFPGKEFVQKTERAGRSRRQLSPSQYTTLLQEITHKQLDVLTARCGNASKICVPGQKGEPGQRGDTGLKGDPGLNGVPGQKGEPGISTSGSNGLPGSKGEPGLMGLMGAPGPRGEKGEKGDLGPQGPPGVKGDAPTRKQLDMCCNTLAAPTIQGSSNDILTVEHGRDITLPCRTTGSPQADKSWSPGVDPTQHGRYVQTTEGLEITNAQYLDSRMFTCTASNIFGSREKHVYLVVIDPIQVNLTPSTLDVTSSSTPSLDFLCTYKGIPPPRVQWFHVGPDGTKQNVTSQAQTGGGRSTLHVSNPDALSSGQYTCNVLNNYESQSQTASVTVHSKPAIMKGPGSKTVNIGDTVILRCDVAGDPKPTVTWTFPKTGTAVPKDVQLNADGSITIVHVDQFSEGDYQCTATNSFGSATTSGHLNVIVPLVVQTHTEELPVTSETFVELQCTGSGNPSPTLTWQKVDSSPLNSDPSKYIMLPNGNLIITGFNSETDTGYYVCNGTNTQGTAGDYTLVYKNVGLLQCNSTFTECSTKIGMACGGQCPGNCDVTNSGIVYGFKSYTPNSPVCLAGRHMGVVGRPGDMVIWTVGAGGDTFEGRQNNGITSQFSGPLAEKVTLYSKRPQIGGHVTIAPIAPLGGVKTMSDTSRPVIKLPIVDMSKTESDRAGLAKIVVDALENIGFLFIDNVEGLDFDRLFQACQWFFSLPPEKKRKLCRKNWVPENPNIYRGYFPVVEGEPSRKEGFEFGRAVSPDDVQVSPENWYYETCPWPEEDGKFPFKEYMTSMYEVMHELAMEILRLTALGLGLPEGAFTYLFDDKPCSTYRILHYPPWNGPPPSNARIEDGKILTTPDHSDSNFLTLLATFNYKGLEIVNSEGNWVAVEPRPKSLVMNIGDLFDRMTGGNKFRATRHRVLDIGVDRFSVPFFLEPSYFSDVGVNLIKKYIGEESHEPEKYGCYMIRVAKYERKYFEYKVLPDFEKVGERLGLVDPVGS